MKTQLKQGKKCIRGETKKRKLALRSAQTCDPVQVKMLGINCKTMTEAEQSLPKLPDLIAHRKDVAAAWQRGRFLRNLRGLASVAVTVDEAAKRLELADPDELQHMIENDPEVRDTWHQARQEALIHIKLALAKTAFEGNQAAIRAVENLLHAEMNHRTAPKLTITDIANVTGRSRHLVYNWTQRNNLPLGLDKTIELKDFLKWFETFTVESAVAKFGQKSDQTNQLHQVKAEQIKMEIKRRRHELLPREEVMRGILARHQVLINSMRQKAPQMAQLCQGQESERIIKIITDSLADICRELCQVPAQLCLPEPAAKAYQKVLEILNDEFTKSGD
jgi:hypothetical protein